MKTKLEVIYLDSKDTITTSSCLKAAGVSYIIGDGSYQNAVFNGDSTSNQAGNNQTIHANITASSSGKTQGYWHFDSNGYIYEKCPHDPDMNEVYKEHNITQAPGA